ncbi:MAG: mechanosensitive ion channel family protein [Deltaproteobacteria bacterium]|nr:mechanosensitive ion channel family protein [Deltaproteobacteria bacterium]
MCGAYPAVLADPAPAIKVNEVKASAVVFVVRPWVKTEDYWTTFWDLNREAKIRLDAAGIPMGAERHQAQLSGGPGAG